MVWLPFNDLWTVFELECASIDVTTYFGIQYFNIVMVYVLIAYYFFWTCPWLSPSQIHGLSTDYPSTWFSITNPSHLRLSMIKICDFVMRIHNHIAGYPWSLSMINPWSIHDLSGTMINPWKIHERSMKNPWKIHDQSMTFLEVIESHQDVPGNPRPGAAERLMMRPERPCGDGPCWHCMAGWTTVAGRQPAAGGSRGTWL